MVIRYCGNKVVVWVAQDEGEVVNGAVSNTIEVSTTSTLLFGARLALSLPVGTAPGRSQSVCPGPAAPFRILSSPDATVPRASASPRVTSPLGFTMCCGYRRDLPVPSTALRLLNQSKFCHSIKWKKNHGCSEDGLMHRN